jgi:hypothetical protein
VIPDGRVRAEDAFISLEDSGATEKAEDALPREKLMGLASRTRHGLYEIPTDRIVWCAYFPLLRLCTDDFLLDKI